MKLPWTKPAMLGIDIQPDAIRLGQVQAKRGGYFLQRLEAIPLPDIFVEEGKIKQWDKLTETLYQAVEVLALKAMPAIVAVPVSMVRIKKMTLPRPLAEEALESEINTQIHRELLGMNGHLSVDYHLSPIPQSAKQTAHCVAMREDYLSRLVTAIHSAGINLKVVDVDVYALQRMFCREIKHQAIGVLCVLKHYVMFAVYQQHDVLFVQSWYTPQLDRFFHQFPSVFSQIVALDEVKQCNQFVVAAPMEYREWVMTALTSFGQQQIRYVDQLDLHIDHHLAGLAPSLRDLNFMFACGLAMREAPLW